MGRVVGTVARGLRCPIINQGDNIATITVESVLKASETENFSIQDKDIVAITESVVARAQGNYATIDVIAQDIKDKFNDDRSEEHTSELQSRGHLVCRLLLEKKKK